MALASGLAPAAFAARHLPDAGTREMMELPGFGHPLYPDGDSRAAYLLERLGRMRDDWPRIDGILAVGAALGERRGTAPNADFALAALEAAFELPVTAGPVLFALARTAGWIAHAAEQIADGGMLRPRALCRQFPRLGLRAQRRVSPGRARAVACFTSSGNGRASP